MPTENMMRVFHIDDGENVASYAIRDSHVNITYGECLTVAATQSKIVTVENNPGWKLQKDSVVVVHFVYAVPASATLNVAETGAKSIYLKGAAIGAVIQAGDIVTFMYDGTNYVVISIDRVMADLNNKLETSLKGAANGLAELDANGKVPSSQLPSFVDDVLEYSSMSSFPVTGESGKIYVATDTNKTYRWGETGYFITSDPNVMTGASASGNGSSGLVPAPSAGDQGKFLRGDATWYEIPATVDFSGATSSAAGARGLVPSPSAGDQFKVLTGGGTWEESPGARVVEVEGTVSNVSGSYAQNFSNEEVVAGMKAVELELSNPEIFNGKITVTPGAGQVLVSCPSVAGQSTIKISLIKVVTDPELVTSSEFDILSNRIEAILNCFGLTYYNGGIYVDPDQE